MHTLRSHSRLRICALTGSLGGDSCVHENLGSSKEHCSYSGTAPSPATMLTWVLGELHMPHGEDVTLRIMQ